MKYYSVIKKNEVIPFATTWMYLESVILSEVNQTEKEKYHMTYLICGIEKEMIQMNFQNRLTDFWKELMVAREEWRRIEERDTVFGIYIKWIPAIF